MCEASSWWVEQRFKECVPPCLDSNTWGHILTFSSLSRSTCSLWWVTMITLRSHLFLFLRDVGQSSVSGRCCGTVLAQARGDCFDLRCPHTLYIGLPDAADNIFARGNARVAITTKCEHWIVFSSERARSRDHGRSYIQLSCASLICMLLCVESLAGRGYIESSVERACELLSQGVSVT